MDTHTMKAFPSPAMDNTVLNEKAKVFHKTLNQPFSSCLCYHLHTIWLFTRSDFKTIVIPQTAFGILSLLSTPIVTASSAFPSITFSLCQIPSVFFWTWINLLPFTISNQRLPDAIREDMINKPWRPLPSGRLSPQQATCLMLGLYLVACITSLQLGGMKQCISLIILGYCYNDLGGGDKSCVLRNFINACGFLCFASGAADVATSAYLHSSLPKADTRWLWVIGAVVLTTVHTQDMYDQEGDRLRGRWTVPLSWGDAPARWMIAVAVTWWSWFCPHFWSVGLIGYVGPTVTGGIIVYRVLSARSVKTDKRTFRLWNFWMVMLYMLEVIKRTSE